MERPASQPTGQAQSQAGTPINLRAVQWLLGLATFSLIFIYHTYPLGLSDFWWHLNTGRWIWNHGAMPVDDPFLFSSASPLDARASLILRGYPLSQLLYYGIYSVSGAYGLVVLKGLLMSVFYGLLWNHFRRGGLHPVTALAVVGALPLLFFRFDELRPQQFSFIFTLLVLQWTESMLACERNGQSAKRYLFLLPSLMLVWANLHRGFIIGIGILFVYLGAEWLARKRNRDPLSDRAFRRLGILTVVATGISFVNPVGITALWASFTELSGPFSHVIDEFLGTLNYFRFIGIPHIGYLIMAAALVPAAALLIRYRQPGVAHWLLLCAFLVAGILSFRFSLLMVAVVLAIACGYFVQDLNRWLGRAKAVPLILLWCASTILLANAALQRSSLGILPAGIASLAGSPLETAVIPSAAIDYLEQARPSGTLFNYFEYGGYASWRLYPKKIFIDQRNLSWATYEEYSQCWRGEYPGVFRKYGIGAVLYPIHEQPTGKLSRLVAGLLRDRHWGVGYYNRREIVLLNMDSNGTLPMLDKSAVIRDILNRQPGRR